jgi:hypothetical protein
MMPGEASRETISTGEYRRLRRRYKRVREGKEPPTVGFLDETDRDSQDAVKARLPNRISQALLDEIQTADAPDAETFEFGAGLHLIAPPEREIEAAERRANDPLEPLYAWADQVDVRRALTPTESIQLLFYEFMRGSPKKGLVMFRHPPQERVLVDVDETQGIVTIAGWDHWKLGDITVLGPAYTTRVGNVRRKIGVRGLNGYTYDGFQDRLELPAPASWYPLVTLVRRRTR